MHEVWFINLLVKQEQQIEHQPNLRATYLGKSLYLSLYYRHIYEFHSQSANGQVKAR